VSAQRAPTIEDVRRAALRLVVRRDLRAPLDPVALAAAMGLDLDPWQRRVVTSAARNLILNVARQTGKSTVASILSGHTALTVPHAPILILSPSQRQSDRLLGVVKDNLARAGEYADEVEVEQVRSLRMRNGAEIAALPGKDETIRGFAGVRLILIDEASRVRDSLYRAVRPMLATTGGRTVLLSTPFGKRGFFWETWERRRELDARGRPRWHAEEVRADQCPRITPEFLAEERATLPEWFYRQEYLVEFVDTDEQYFTSDEVAAALDATVAPWDFAAA
jgi:hypothetical protein